MTEAGRGGGRAAVAEGERSVALGGNAVGSVIVTGNNNTLRLDVGLASGDLLEVLRRSAAPVKRALATPLFARPAPFADHVDREREASSVLAAAETASPVNLYGDVGVGKTYVLSFAANQPAAEGMSDGVVFVDGEDAGREDLLQAVFDEFYAYQPEGKPAPSEIRRDLRDKEALVFVDPFALEPEEAQRCFMTASRCRFVVASRERKVWEGSPHRLDGLALPDALLVMEHELKRRVTDAERPAAEAICQALGGNPRRIRRAASAVRDDGVAVHDVAGRLAGADPARALSDLTLESSSPDERRVLSTLAVFGSASVGTEHVRALTGLGEVQAPLERLERRGVVASCSPRYRLTGIGAEDIERVEDVDGETVRAVAHFAEWAEANRRDPDAQLTEWRALLALVRSALRRGHHRGVIRLGRAISAAFASSRRWGAWQEVLEAVVGAGRRVGDRGAEAWALHQLGTRSVCLGERDHGAKLLREALRIRQEIGDAAGEVATRHNLRALRPWWLPKRVMRFPLVAVVLVAAMVVAAGGRALLAGGDPVRSVSVTKTGGGMGTVISSPSGIECGPTCDATFDTGTDVTLTASAAPGSAFVGWRGGNCSGVRPCTMRVDRNVSVTAEFAVVGLTRTLEVARGGDGRGTVTSSPSGIDCGPSCSASFPDGTQVTLTATAEAGSVFAGWQGDACSGPGSCTLPLAKDASVSALFQLAPATRSLEVHRKGAGGGVITSIPSGIDCGPSCTASFAEGTEVTIIATAEAGTVFAGWEGGGCSGSGSCTLVLARDASVTARFQTSAGTRVLGVTKSGSGTGSVSSFPSGIDCGPSCTASFPDGAQVSLTATAAPGSLFAGWQGGGCSGTRPCQLALQRDTSVSALFQLAPVTRTLTVNKEGRGQGTVTSSPSGIDCDPSCTASFADRSSVTLTAAASKGSVFAGWNGGDCSGSDPCTVTLSRDTSVTALFQRAPVARMLSVEKVGKGTGTVTSSPSGIDCGRSCQASFPEGTRVTLTAVAAQSSTFAGWRVRGCSGTGPCTVTMTRDASVTAVFDPVTYVLTVTINDGQPNQAENRVTSEPPGIDCVSSCTARFAEGSPVTLRAVPAPGWVFANWSEAACGGAATCTVTMSKDLTVTAVFYVIPG